VVDTTKNILPNATVSEESLCYKTAGISEPAKEIINISFNWVSKPEPKSPTNLTNTLPTLPTSHLAPKSPRIESRRSPSHRFERKRRRNTRHDNVQRSTDINRHRRRRIRPSSNARADDSHDPVQTDRDAVARAPVSRREDFWRVGVKGAVVDILLRSLSARADGGGDRDG
jgi:hypothetical protein